MFSRAQILLAALCFGTTGTAQALGPAGTEPAGVGASRILVGALLLLLIARGVPRARGGILLAGAGVAIYQLSFFAAVDRTGVAVGTVVAIGSGPAIAGMLGRLVNGDALDGRWAGATALACAGVALLGLGGGGTHAAVDPLGIGLAVLAGAGYAAYTVLAKRMLTAGERPERVMAGAFAAGAVILLPVFVLAGHGLATPGGVALALYLGAIPTALAYVLDARGLQRVSAGEAATLTLAEPLTAAVLGAAVLGERPGALGVAGAALVLGGVLALALPRRRTALRGLAVAEARA
jgi:drug/metabolite transporter, DME family